jgi:hypothetical protein
MRVDAHRWIEATIVGNLLLNGNDTRVCKATIRDAHGNVGPSMTLRFFWMPNIKLFVDTDGHHYACFLGHHRGEPTVLVSIRKRDMVVCGEYYAEDGVSLHSLPGGGALLARFDRVIDRAGQMVLPVRRWHLDDDVAEIIRFRHGKFTTLGLIFLPQQE